MKFGCLLALTALGVLSGSERARAAGSSAPPQASTATPAPAPAPVPVPDDKALDEGAPQVATPAPDSYLPMVLSVQYTYVLQHQSPLHSPYASRSSLQSDGDTQPTNTFGVYTGWAPVTWGQIYFDVEKFTGAPINDGTGLGGPPNGNTRTWRAGLNKQFYIARLYTRFMLPLGDGVIPVDRGVDRVPGAEAARRLELKIGRMAAPDDFDQNRYAGSARSEFLNGSLEQDTAWDYAADARGYTDGIVLGYVSPNWSLKYGIYRMPAAARGQHLVGSLARANGQNLQLRLSPFRAGTIVRLLAYQNTAAMGSYQQALSIAAAMHTLPQIAATSRPGRRNGGFGADVEQPLADDGHTGLFVRWGWDDGREQSFPFSEVDRLLSVGIQVAGSEWHQPGAQAGLGLVSEGLSAPHRQYLAAGGSDFLLGDGRLHYGPEQILEA